MGGSNTKLSVMLCSVCSRFGEIIKRALIPKFKSVKCAHDRPPAAIKFDDNLLCQGASFPCCQCRTHIIWIFLFVDRQNKTEHAETMSGINSPVLLSVSWSRNVTQGELRISQIFCTIVCLFSRPLKGCIIFLAGCLTFTMERLWGFPDQWPEPAHKACTSPARGNSTAGRV